MSFQGFFRTSTQGLIVITFALECLLSGVNVQAGDSSYIKHKEEEIKTFTKDLSELDTRIKQLGIPSIRMPEFLGAECHCDPAKTSLCSLGDYTKTNVTQTAVGQDGCTFLHKADPDLVLVSVTCAAEMEKCGPIKRKIALAA